MVVNFLKQITDVIPTEDEVCYDELGRLVEHIAELKRKLTSSEKELKVKVEEYNKKNNIPFEYQSDTAQYTLKSRNTQLISPQQMLDIVKQHCSTDNDYIDNLEKIINDLNIKKSDVGKIGIPDFMLTQVSIIDTSEESYTLATKLKGKKSE